MAGVSLGMIVEGSVALLLLLSIGYSIVLNERLKRLHADRTELKQMVADLVKATDLANVAIQQLKEAAGEADATLGARLSEAETFAVHLATHVNAGQAVLDRISKITQAAKKNASATAPAGNRASAALQALKAHQGEKGRAA